MTQSRLYYEAHITIEPAEGQEFQDFAQVAQMGGWKASRFGEDEVDHYEGHFFVSRRGKHLEIMKRAVATTVSYFEMASYKVIRWKIEDTLLDSKHGDTL